MAISHQRKRLNTVVTSHANKLLKRKSTESLDNERPTTKKDFEIQRHQQQMADERSDEAESEDEEDVEEDDDSPVII